MHIKNSRVFKRLTVTEVKCSENLLCKSFKGQLWGYISAGIRKSSTPNHAKAIIAENTHVKTQTILHKMWKECLPSFLTSFLSLFSFLRSSADMQGMLFSLASSMCIWSPRTQIFMLGLGMCFNLLGRCNYMNSLVSQTSLLKIKQTYNFQN